VSMFSAMTALIIGLTRLEQTLHRNHRLPTGRAALRAWWGATKNASDEECRLLAGRSSKEAEP
jgi:hypothetical protein